MRFYHLLILAFALSVPAWANINTTACSEDTSSFDSHRSSKTAAGRGLKEYVWDDEGRPLAQIAGGTLTYLHPDHLGTPRFGTDAGRNIVWQWYERPFGTGPPVGSVVVNLRYPGQYYDAETGLHQNWHRTYDPGVGAVSGE